ncbi:uncharacterized protein LOC104437193 isoform X1 [Eucalyptus grandis]|uniref:uncharacterized protein LOC104437193 isoform X1 n=2 Tax=Eucalyptus grandis TaxID=71139 RepID=UPI00192ED37E|nr:uncharacterized protein LOC104437193 isoform X1 [Eucalyptus grandis]
MSINQFAMVEELASLVKDNFPCKHLVLSVEEGLVNFLQDDSSGDEILELEPMNPYNRLLLHRLADIFGFAHESVGEGDDRHLILERCLETSIPSILVSDILWQSDEPQPPPSSYQILRRKDAPTVLITNVPSSQDTFKEREAAYLAARERIFAFDSQEMREPVTQRPRNVPVVARRMIAHALGQKIGANDQDASVKNSEGYEVGTNGFIVPENDNYTQEPDQNMSEKAKGENHDVCATLTGRKVPKGSVQKYANVPSSRSGRGENVANKEYLKKEHIGAAKRMFAQALGRSSVRDGLHSKGAESNQSSST